MAASAKCMNLNVYASTYKYPLYTSGSFVTLEMKGQFLSALHCGKKYSLLLSSGYSMHTDTENSHNVHSAHTAENRAAMRAELM